MVRCLGVSGWARDVGAELARMIPAKDMDGRVNVGFVMGGRCFVEFERERDERVVNVSARSFSPKRGRRPNNCDNWRGGGCP